MSAILSKILLNFLKAGAVQTALGQNENGIPNIVTAIVAVLGGLFFFIALIIFLVVLPFGALVSLVLPSNISKEGIFPQPVYYEQLGTYAMPCDSSAINSDFGLRDDPFNTGSSETHTGIDFATTHHSPVVAISDGLVTVAKYKDSYGRCVFIKQKLVDKNGVPKDYVTVYGHLSKLYCVAGQTVKAGDVIALEGGEPNVDNNTGNSTGHHLHFEIREEKSWKAIDPKLFILNGKPTAPVATPVPEMGKENTELKGY